MTVTSLITAVYKNETLGQRGKKEPKTNPIKANTKPTCSELACPELSRKVEPISGAKNDRGGDQKHLENKGLL
jgi:hypothetical protein